MFYVESGEITRWKRRLQSKMRKAGYKLFYTLSASSFNIYTDLEANGKSIYVAYDLLKGLQELFIEIPSSKNPNKIGKFRKEILEMLIAEFIAFIKDKGSECYKIDIVSDGKMSEDDIGILQDIASRNELAALETQRYNSVSFANKNLAPMLIKLNQTKNEVDKIFREKRFDKNDSIYYFYSEGKELEKEFHISDVLDKKAFIEILYNTKQYRITWKSAHFTSESLHQDINVDLFFDEYARFEREQRLKVLLDKPVMNKRIESYLRDLNVLIKSEKSVKELFEFLCDYYTLQDMNELSIKRIDANNKTKKEYTERFGDGGLLEIDVHTVQVWGKVLTYRQSEISWMTRRGDYQRQLNNEYVIYESQEEANESNHEWLVNNMLQKQEELLNHLNEDN